MKIGYIGLGKMGKNMVLHLLDQDVEVVAWNRSPGPLEEVVQAGAVGAKDVADLATQLGEAGSRIIWLMLPAGEVTDEFIDKILPLLKPGDLLIDGGNSFYKDTLRRAEKIADTGVHYMDIGTSGGPGGARTGACLMIGGDKTDFERIKELCQKIAAPDAFGHFGPVGSGHFAKMVHNGIEYGMMEALSEGMAILKSSQFNLDLSEILRVYNNKSVIESRLVGWMKEAIDEDPDLTEYSATVGHTGEGEWTAKTADELEVDAKVIKNSYQIRVESDQVPEDSPNGYRNKATSAMRGKFGQHSVRKNV
jgi:6-phosphogluconate dehydrogenase